MDLLHMSLAGGMMILVIALFRAALQHRVHRTVLVVLWIAAALRLLLPVKISSSVSIFNLLTPAPQPEPLASYTTQVPAAQVVAQAPAPAAQAAPVFSLARLLPWIWAAGALAVLGYFLINHIRNRRHYSISLPREGAPVCLPARVQIRSLEGISTPLTYGVWRPVILVPEDFSALEPDKQRQMLFHELAHIRHKDVLTKAFLLLTLAVHWFNPLVWGMVYTACQDIEMRADADAVTRTGKKTDYARTLVEVEARRLDGYLTTGFSYSNTGARLKALQKGKAGLWRSAICLVVLLTLMLGLFATEARAAVPSKPAPVEAAGEPDLEPSPAQDAAAQTAQAGPEAAIAPEAEPVPDQVQVTEAAPQPPEIEKPGIRPTPRTSLPTAQEPPQPTEPEPEPTWTQPTESDSDYEADAQSTSEYIDDPFINFEPDPFVPYSGNPDVSAPETPGTWNPEIGPTFGTDANGNPTVVINLYP